MRRLFPIVFSVVVVLEEQANVGQFCIFVRQRLQSPGKHEE